MKTLVLLQILILLHWREMELTAQLCGEAIIATRFVIFIIDLLVQILVSLGLLILMMPQCSIFI